MIQRRLSTDAPIASLTPSERVRVVKAALSAILKTNREETADFKISLIETRFLEEAELRGKSPTLEVKIYLGRPDLLIGGHARYVDFVKYALEYVLDHNVTIGLVETFPEYL